MTQPHEIESVLAADIGSTHTRVCLIDRVEGTYRLVARAQHPTRDEMGIDARRAVVRATRRIEQIVQRTLLGADDELLTPGRDDGAGVDAVVACSSAARPLDCAVVGLTADLSLLSATRACTGALTHLTTTIALGPQRGAASLAPLVRLADAPPEVLVLTGGFDNGPVAPIEAAAEMLAAVLADLPAEGRPTIIYAGNQEARRPVARALGPLLALSVVDNVRPSEGVESPRELQRELLRLYDQRLTLLPGIEALQRWCCAPIEGSHDALSLALEYLARRGDVPSSLLGVDVGGSVTTLLSAGQDGRRATVRPGLGTASGIAGLLGGAGLEQVAQWVPAEMPADALQAALENARLWPSTIPQTLDDLLVVQAVAREALRQTYAQWREGLPATGAPTFDLIGARGGVLSGCPHVGLVALLLLDALQPVGLARLVYDRDSLWPQLGALAAVAPLAASQVLNRDGVAELGTAVCLGGSLRTGSRALRLQIEAHGEPQRAFEVAAGEVLCVPLGADERVTLKLWPHSRLDVGLGRRGVPAQAQVQGGLLGLIIDARGRPLRLPADPKKRAALQRVWFESLSVR